MIDDVDEILTAELIEEDDGSSIASRMKRLEEAKRVALELEKAAAAKMRQARGMLPRQQRETKSIAGNTVDALIESLQRPGGVQQAILLKEILDRPVDRW